MTQHIIDLLAQASAELETAINEMGDYHHASEFARISDHVDSAITRATQVQRSRPTDHA
jgi:hypothetical protein